MELKPRLSGSGPNITIETYSFSLRRATNSALASPNQNMIWAGYGSISEIGTRFTWVQKVPYKQIISKLGLAAIRTDGTINQPPQFLNGAIPRFRVWTSPNYLIGPFTLLADISLSEDDTLRPAPKFIFPDLIIGENLDWQITCGVTGQAPGGAQSYLAIATISGVK